MTTAQNSSDNVCLQVYLGIGGANPAIPWEPGPKSIWFCCDFCICSICALSVSKMTGAKSIIELVKNIHDAEHANWYSETTLFSVTVKTFSEKFLTGSGSISVSPINRSPNVSSGS